jgi:hypothetical protein
MKNNMGYYINENSRGQLIGGSFLEKVRSLIDDGAIEIETPTEFTENLICAVDNGYFGAIGYAYDEKEMNIFINGMANRKFQWFIYNHAKELAK